MSEQCLVYCPRCSKEHIVLLGQPKFMCDECRQEYAIAIAQRRELESAAAMVSDLRSQVHRTRAEPSTADGAPDPYLGVSESALEKLEDLLTRAQSPLGRVTISREDRHLVSLERAKGLGEADAELSVALSVFTLFLGLILQEVVASGWSAKVTALLLGTLASGGAAGYTYWKARDRKHRLIDDAVACAIPVRSILLEDGEDSADSPTLSPIDE